jgi:hypothetical protein
MLKGNLSTRPFYNDRLVSLTIGIIAAAVVALMAFNATELISLSKARSSFTAEIKKNDEETQKLRDAALKLTRTVDPVNLKALSVYVNEANYLIDRRTFSWTALLGVIERMLPYGAKVVEIAPKPEKNVMHLDMTIVFKRPEDLLSVIEAMEKTDLFKEVVPAAQNPNDDGTSTALIQAIYLAPMGEAPQPAKGKKGHP